MTTAQQAIHAALEHIGALGIEIEDDATEAMRLYPALASPVRPVPPPAADPDREYWYGVEPPPSDGYEWFEPASEFQKLAESYSPRVPLTSGDDGVIWMGSSGRCLEPLITEGETLKAFDPRIPAQHGDLVLVQWSVDELTAIAEMWAADPSIAEESLSTGATKFLVAFGGTYLVLCKSGCMPLGKSRVLAVCRALAPTPITWS